jgi:hypothetical protein
MVSKSICTTDDDVIAGAQARSSAEVRLSVPFEPADAADASFLEHDHLSPGAHHAIG